MISNKVIILLVVLVVFNSVNGEKRLRFQIKEIKTWSDNVNVNTTHIINQTVPSADIIFRVLQPLDNIEVIILGNMWTKENDKHYASINTSYSLCKILSYKNSSPITMLLHAHIKSHGNIPDSCPIKKDTYAINKIWPDDHSVKLKLPEVNFDVEMKAYTIKNNESTLIVHNKIIAEAVYMDLPGELKKTGLLSLLSGR